MAAKRDALDKLSRGLMGNPLQATQAQSEKVNYGTDSRGYVTKAGFSSWPFFVCS
jgi:hypothetical protein